MYLCLGESSMESLENKVWGIHTQNDYLFLKKNIIAVGWKEVGDLTKIPSDRAAFKEHYSQVYCSASKGNIATSAGMLYRFVHEAQVGDYVIFPSKIDRKINIGIIESNYYYCDTEEKYVQQRRVKWLKHFPRTAFTQGALYEVGSALTFFMVKNYADEFLSSLTKNESDMHSDILAEEDETVAATAEEIAESTKDFILKELSKNLKGYDLEDFVADLLHAMGYYNPSVSNRGGDSGVDIVVYKDELPPRILVQVKSQDGDIKEQAIQALKGAMREGDYGLFITLSNFTKNAQKYLQSTPIIRGIKGSELADLILKYYDRLGDKYRMMLPLKMVYIPIGAR